MDILDIRQALRTRTIYDIPLRVTYYARVSSESDEQLNSLGNQVAYYENLIRANGAWTFMPGYVDEGLSGISTRKRENFHRMIADGLAGRFDLIITKEITRFARNTLDSIQYTRRLLAAGVAVLFQNDNINTLDEDSELRLTIMSGIAQDELRKLSSRVRFGHQQAIKSSVVLGNSRMFGYRKDHKRLVIDEAQAPMVRALFERYATGRYSLKQIEDMLWDEGYRNLNGHRVSHVTLSHMIANPKYKGWYAGNKVRVVDMFTRKQKFLPPEEWVMFRDETGEIVPAIVSEALWDAANAVLRRRSADVKARRGVCNHANLLTGKLICARCGQPYYRKDARDAFGQSNSKWVCSGKIKNGSASCPSFAIYESELKPLLYEVFRDARADADAMAEEYLRLYRELANDDALPERAAALEKTIESAGRRKTKLLQLCAEGMISDRDFKTMTDACNAEIDGAREQLDALNAERRAAEAPQARAAALRRALAEAQRDARDGIIDRAFVERYIDRIVVTPEDGNAMRLDVRIFTGETEEKTLPGPNARFARRVSGDGTAPGRAGNMFKKMIEAQERQMSNSGR